jgi:hypothetical protein
VRRREGRVPGAREGRQRCRFVRGVIIPSMWHKPSKETRRARRLGILAAVNGRWFFSRVKVDGLVGWCLSSLNIDEPGMAVVRALLIVTAPAYGNTMSQQVWRVGAGWQEGSGIIMRVTVGTLGVQSHVG